MPGDALIEAFASAKARFARADSFRVFHGRGGCYSGLEFLAIDFFKPTLVVTIYRTPPVGFIDTLLDYVQTQVMSEHISCLLIQRRDLKSWGLQVLAGSRPSDFRALRNNLFFQLQSDKQNIGYFLDIEPARCWLESLAPAKNILNLFAFTCSFSVVAMAAGANSVLNMDMSKSALYTGRGNHSRNDLTTDKVTFLVHDILRSWGKLIRKGPYDLVIVDPPSMQRGSFVARQDYPKIINRLPVLLCNDGLALLCLNAPEISCAEFMEMIANCDQPLVFQEALSANPDFPDAGESSLKMLVYRLEAGVGMPPL